MYAARSPGLLMSTSLDVAPVSTFFEDFIMFHH
jgi:hypothetical protein